MKVEPIKKKCEVLKEGYNAGEDAQIPQNFLPFNAGEDAESEGEDEPEDREVSELGGQYYQIRCNGTKYQNYN